MPIRFRCAYCNQLLGIARRKAGTVVRCPTCAGQVIVPTVEAEPGQPPSSGSEPFLFERSDFDEILNTDGDQAVALNRKPNGSDEAPASVPAPAEPPGAWGTHPEPPYDVQRLTPAPPGAARTTGRPFAIALSRAQATLLVVAAIVLLALVFAGGVLVGFLLRGAPPAPESHAPSGRPRVVGRIFNPSGTVDGLKIRPTARDAFAGAGST